MPATVIDTPLAVSCVFSDGSTARFRLDDLPCRRLVRDLLAGLVELIHPHGAVNAAGSVARADRATPAAGRPWSDRTPERRRRRCRAPASLRGGSAPSPDTPRFASRTNAAAGHVTIKYLEPDFATLFLNGLRGLAPDGVLDTGYHGRELARNGAIGELALATGLRLQEFTHLVSYEIPALPIRPTVVPVPFPVPSGITKGRKYRTTWISYEALAAVHRYLDLDRAVTAEGSSWLPRRGEPLLVSEPDARGARIGGVRRSWDTVTPDERLRLVAPDGGSCLVALRNDGGPFTAWATVFERTSNRLRARFEPRFPHVHPHSAATLRWPGRSARCAEGRR
jgi:hypothetical protein